MSWLDFPIGQGWNPPTEYGVDINTPFHTPITSIFGGTVVEAQRTDWGGGLSSGGIVTILADVPGLGQELTYYLHLDSINQGIQPGVTVQPGTLLGLSGGQTSGGNWPTSPKFSTGPHTEFGVDAPFAGPGSNIGTNVNPLTFLGGGPSNVTPAQQSPSSDPVTSLWNQIFGAAGSAFQQFTERGSLIVIGIVLIFIAIFVIFFSGGKKEIVNIGNDPKGAAALAAA